MKVGNKITLNRSFKNEENSDVIFIAKNQNGLAVSFPAHRQILMSQSPVFERMFYGDLKEKSPVEIPDACAEAFEEFLQLFYLAEVDLTPHNIAEVLKLVDKYDAEAFWPSCEEFMAKTLTQALALQYYELVSSFNLSDGLKSKTEEIIRRSSKKVFELGTGMTNASVLSTILQWNSLLGKEIDIFDGVMAWAKALLQQQNRPTTVDNIKEVLGECLQHIRFPLMSINELLECFMEYENLLPSMQCFAILKYVSTKQPSSVLEQLNCKERGDDEFAILLEQIINSLVERQRYE